MTNPAVTLPLHTDKSEMRAQLLQRASEMVDRLAAGAAAREQHRSIEPEIIDEMRQAGFFRAMQPARHSGHELDFSFMIDMAKVLGRGCGSTAWVTNLYIVHQWLVATYPLEVQEEVLGSDPDATVCGSYAPAGKTEHRDGGYSVSGAFLFASGCDNAKWAVIGIMVPPKDGKGGPTPGFALVPASDYSIDDNWHTAGLAATGSKTLVMDDVFVPANRFVPFADLMAGTTPGARALDIPLYSVSFLGALPICIATPALGMVHGAIDAFVEEIGTRETRGAVRGGAHRLAEFEIIQGRLGEASALVDAAELLLRRDCEDAIVKAEAGIQLDVATRIRNRRDHAFAVHLCDRAADGLFRCTGGKGLFLDNALQRTWRDVRAVSHHVSLNWDAVSTMTGQHMLGLEPRGQY